MREPGEVATQKERPALLPAFRGRDPKLPHSLRHRLTRLKSASLVARFDSFERGAGDLWGSPADAQYSPGFSAENRGKKIRLPGPAARSQPDLDSFCG